MSKHGISDLRDFKVPSGQSPQQTWLDAVLALPWVGAWPLPPDLFLKDHSTQVSKRETQYISVIWIQIPGIYNIGWVILVSL